MKKHIYKLTGVVLLAIVVFSTNAQMPAAITIEPANATVYDEITLTFDPEEACFETASLSGFAYVAMHSGVNIDNNGWQYVVPFDATGANGQSPILNMNPDNTYSITFTPFEFYGFPPGANVIEINAVFNNGTNWDNDGRDFVPGGSDCMDFFIPIDPGTPPLVPYLESIQPDNGDQGALVDVQIFTLNTNFLSATTTAWLSYEGEQIYFDAVVAVNDTLITAQIGIPGDAEPVSWDLMVENPVDGTLSLEEAFYINDTSVVIPPMPEAITIFPPDATAFDDISLTLDTKLSCPAGDLYDAEMVMMHSGVTVNGMAWQNVIEFDATGINGQTPELIDNGDSTWTISFNPAAFYGIDPGTVVTAINCVFNGGGWDLGEAKDFDDNGDCIDFLIPLSIPTGINPKTDTKFVIYPNPAEDVVYIRSEEPVGEIALFDAMGKRVKYYTSINHISEIEITNLDNGIYILKGTSENGNIFRKKIIKR